MKNKTMIVMLTSALLILIGMCIKQVIQNITSDEEQYEYVISPSKNLSSVDTTDINQIEFKGVEFEQKTMTLVNIWATWCPPCIMEMPHLEEVYNLMQEQNVGVVALVTDVVVNGSIDEQVLSNVENIKEEANITFPIIYPDSEFENKILSEVYAYPTTFFVDDKANVVGNIYQGARTAQEWIEIINEELQKLDE